MTPLDVYAGAAVTWDRSTSLVYQPLAKELVRRVGAPLDGRLVIEAGAGTGCATRELRAVGARVIATDLSHPMLNLNRVERPPSTVSDITLLPFETDVADHAVAAFVMNHLPDPALALAELARVVRPGGRIATDVFSNASKSPARDAIDDAAGLHGYTPPDWYDDLRNIYADQTGTAEGFAAFAEQAGLRDIDVVEAVVDTGVTAPRDLVDYRLGMAQFSDWIGSLSDAERAAAWRDAEVSARAVMTPYAPVVLFLTATSP